MLGASELLPTADFKRFILFTCCRCSCICRWYPNEQSIRRSSNDSPRAKRVFDNQIRGLSIEMLTKKSATKLDSAFPAAENSFSPRTQESCISVFVFSISTANEEEHCQLTVRDSDARVASSVSEPPTRQPSLIENREADTAISSAGNFETREAYT